MACLVEKACAGAQHPDWSHKYIIILHEGICYSGLVSVPGSKLLPFHQEINRLELWNIVEPILWTSLDFASQQQLNCFY